MKIILLGYMGVGKTSLSKKLSKKLEIPCFDLDEIIEKSESLSVSAIFKDKGEVYFRKIEHQLFKNFIEKEENYILSLGGGTPCYANNHLLLQNEDVTSIYLKASIGNLVEKLKNKREKRPLIKNLTEDELQEYIAKHLFDRNYYYQNSKLTVVVDGKSKKEIVKEILQLI
ncbi:shikimate kinase [Flavobacterium gelidilacus]|jgi:shikimate kinase|uniref:shikimate kinase n=1 Tax=Flavobacterium gelidilacus TaxID=206041 RepID=UPI0003FBCFEE|nr:shikimate kinase [Flavobacterium gelidilacus]